MAAMLWPNDPLTALANRFHSDKGTVANCAHGYTRVYHQLFESLQPCPIKLAEIGLVHGHTQQAAPQLIDQYGCPSLEMWSAFLPFAEIFGFDIIDFSRHTRDRVHIQQGDQGNREDLARFVSTTGMLDIVIDDGSHASHHQQCSLGSLFPHLAPGGLYIVEDLHFQPSELELNGMLKTKDFLCSLSALPRGKSVGLNQVEYAYLLKNIESIHFFDSISARWPLKVTCDALAVIKKRGEHTYIDKASTL